MWPPLLYILYIYVYSHIAASGWIITQHTQHYTLHNTIHIIHYKELLNTATPTVVSFGLICGFHKCICLFLVYRTASSSGQCVVLRIMGT